MLVDLATNHIFELNRTGHRIWELLGEGLDRRAIRDRLQQEFSVDPEQLEQELEKLLNALKLEQLIADK